MPGFFRRKSARLAEGDSVLRHPVEFDVSGDGNGCGLKRGEHLLYIARMRKVIGGQESHELGTGELDAVIKASAITTVIITGDKADARIAGRLDHGKAIISRGVIDNDYFEAPVGLSSQGVEEVVEVTSVIITRTDDRK